MFNKSEDDEKENEKKKGNLQESIKSILHLHSSTNQKQQKLLKRRSWEGRDVIWNKWSHSLEKRKERETTNINLYKKKESHLSKSFLSFLTIQAIQKSIMGGDRGDVSCYKRWDGWER